ncbi:DUF6504 family protein [Nitrospirillum bahiense]|uniref:DUF6504 family protein n=1 Tax=Nitrospirillum amazonense TaxID=28077 RepID=UPI0011A35EA6|nr:DUF6504 family protein [Nitrospirillum amazonense]
MRRYVSIWLGRWPTDLWRRRNDAPSDRPLVTTAAGQGGVRLQAVDTLAARQGLRPGMTLADAQAVVPALQASLADWATRFTPLVALDGTDGLLLDITGCAHLFGGEPGLLGDLDRCLAKAGISALSATASTPAAAWAWARFHTTAGGGPILPDGQAARDALWRLPLSALRLSDRLVDDLSRVGIRRVEELARLPRAPLAARYGLEPLRRLDQLTGDAPEPMTPVRPQAPYIVRMPFAEPISRREDIDAAALHLLREMGGRLAQDGKGARQLDLGFIRTDATSQRVAVGTGRPMRDARHLLSLFGEKFSQVDPGFGVEAMVLEAVSVDAMAPEQAGLEGAAGGTELEALVDRVVNRVGPARMGQPRPVDTHVPERAVRRGTVDDPVSSADEWASDAPCPVLLLPRPEPVDVSSVLPSGTPAAFRWRGDRYLVARLEGPERLRGEWWHGEAPAQRDYWRMQMVDGRQFWLFQAAETWFMHGWFA